MVFVLAGTKQIGTEPRATTEHLPEFGLRKNNLEENQIDDVGYIDAGVEHIKCWRCWSAGERAKEGQLFRKRSCRSGAVDGSTAGANSSHRPNYPRAEAPACGHAPHGGRFCLVGTSPL